MCVCIFYFSLSNLESACQVIKFDGEILTQIICLYVVHKANLKKEYGLISKY